MLPELLQHLLVVFFELQQMLVRFLLDGEALQYLLRMNRLAPESPFLMCYTQTLRVIRLILI